DSGWSVAMTVGTKSLARTDDRLVASRSRRIEGTFDPGDVVFVRPIHEDRVKTARAVRMATSCAVQPPAGRQDDALAFARGDAFGRTCKVRVGAQAHLDEYQHVSLHADEVDFAATTTDVASHLREPTAG